MKKNRVILMIAAGVGAGSIATTGQAAAHSSSESTGFDNGATLTAGIWMQTFSDGKSCGDFKTRVTIAHKPEWIKNRTSFNANGIGATINGAGWNFNGASASHEILNSEGQKGSYLSGRVCGNLATVYIGGSVTGSALQYGNSRSVTASI